MTSDPAARLSSALAFLGDRLLHMTQEGARAGGRVSLVISGDGMPPDGRTDLEHQVRAALADLGLADVRIAMIRERPVRHLIVVASGKGGVGKSTVSANLAVALARSGRKVGLVDADIYGPSQPRLLGVEGVRPEAIDQPDGKPSRLIPVITPSGVRLLSLGQLVAPGKALAWRGPMATSALAQLVDAEWGDCDTIIVDLPPGTGDVQLSMVRSHRPVGAVIVSTPQDLALIDARRAVDLFDQTGVPVIGWVENMAGYVCPHCGERSDPFGHGGAEAEAGALGAPLLARIPLDLLIRQQSDAGTPPAAGDGPQGRAFADLAERVAAWLAGLAKTG